MSKKVGNIFVIEEEPEGACELCGKVAELRPYGPNGENICFQCGTATPEAEATSTRKFLERLLGTDTLERDGQVIAKRHIH